MNINLVLATGLAYSVIGALIMFVSHRALYRKATRIVAGYPRVLAALKIQRHDGRCGLTILACGSLLQVLAACGYSMPLAYWRYPALAMFAALFVYGVWRLIAGVRIARGARTSAVRSNAKPLYETRRSMILLEAARREAANRRAREMAAAGRDRSVVYVAQEWECRWWSDKLGVTPEALRAAVRQVGPMIGDIERHLGVRYRMPYARAA